MALLVIYADYLSIATFAKDIIIIVFNNIVLRQICILKLCH